MHATPLVAMHAPDGTFSMSVNTVFAVVVVALLALATRSVSRRNDHRLVPLMGLAAAFIFAGQMVNFPVAAGTTGHLLGGTLAAILLGPWAGTLVMAVVILFQATLGDGGITVLGPNIFNMGVVGTCFAYFLYRAHLGKEAQPPARIVAASFFAAWTAVTLAAVFASLQLWASGTASLTRVFPALVLTHMLIGVGEALITAGVVAFIVRTRPELLHGYAASRSAASDATPMGAAESRATDPAASRRVGRGPVVVGLSAALVTAVFLSLLPTLWDHPDGLEAVGAAQGFLWQEPEMNDAGELKTLPAYPLGVRLAAGPTGPRVEHVFVQPAPPALHVGDVVDRINETPTPDLAAVAGALRFDATDARFAVAPGTPLAVAVRQADGVLRELSFPAAATPKAGAAAPLIALLADYTVPGIAGLASTSAAGLIGTVVMFLAAAAVGRALVRPVATGRRTADVAAHS